MTAGRYRRKISENLPILSPSPPPEDEIMHDCDENFTEPRLSLQKSSPVGWLEKLETNSMMIGTDVGNLRVQYISGGEDDEDPREKKIIKTGNPGSPVSCVSDFDGATSSVSTDRREDPKCCDFEKGPPPMPNPLNDQEFFKLHKKALRLEAELFSMRQILSRLMSHPTLNKKGIFNHPVDPVALCLPDYHTVITHPMDLGTVKTKLHSLLYQNRDQACDDIRLVFQNSMKYNPIGNSVHTLARELLAFFEEACHGLGVSRIRHVDIDFNATDIQKNKAVEVQSNDALYVGTGKKRTVSANLPEVSVSSSVDLPGHNPGSSLLVSNVAAVPVFQSASVESMTTDNKKVTRARKSETFSPNGLSRKRKLRLGVSKLPSFSYTHSCEICLGRKCAICEQGCLHLEPVLLICNGANCAGAKIRKGATYYIANDGSCQFCQRCHTGLPAVLPPKSNIEENAVRYKRDLLKRKNEEDTVEKWLTCTQCGKGVHSICAMHNPYVHNEKSYICPTCSCSPSSNCGLPDENSEKGKEELGYTFLTGEHLPVPCSTLLEPTLSSEFGSISAECLRETPVSKFIQQKVRDCILKKASVANADKTVVVRIISNCDRDFKVPSVIRKHFRMPTNQELNGRKVKIDPNGTIEIPEKVKYNSKAIALFQRIDKMDVCIFCMYVHEYDENNASERDDIAVPAKKRVYVAYLDSVEHVRPRACRTSLYHEILVSYLATARARGYEEAHIWACPPSRGNSFIFWNHPATQRTPTKDRLLSWYHNALTRAMECGVVTDVRSLYESHFQQSVGESKKGCNAELSNGLSDGKMVCPPLLDGDYWIEEAVKIHSANIARYLKAKSTIDSEFSKISSSNRHNLCPAIQVATLIKDRVMLHQSALVFRRPVNAAAMNLKDYHKVITKPMDLGTIYSRCVLGEYLVLHDLVIDVKLVFSNAKKYNPKGHFVHTRAEEMEPFFFEELNKLTCTWTNNDKDSLDWEVHADMSMSLNMSFQPEKKKLLIGVKSDESVKENESLRLPVTESKISDRLSSEPNHRLASPDIKTEYVAKKNVLSDESRNRHLNPSSSSELLNGGAKAIMQRMVGEDLWLLNKKNPSPPKKTNSAKNRGRHGTCEPLEKSFTKHRRQTWLGEEVGAAVREMRDCLFTCSLMPGTFTFDQEEDKLLAYSSYTNSFASDSIIDAKHAVASKIADVRHALLEFSQYRNFEFDTLRHAKYSTAMLLYHLHNSDAPGAVPTCTSCHKKIQQVRWHKVTKVVERSRIIKRVTNRNRITFEEAEELCSQCHSELLKGDDFIPLRVSYKI